MSLQHSLLSSTCLDDINIQYFCLFNTCTIANDLNSTEIKYGGILTNSTDIVLIGGSLNWLFVESNDLPVFERFQKMKNLKNETWWWYVEPGINVTRIINSIVYDKENVVEEDEEKEREEGRGGGGVGVGVEGGIKLLIENLTDWKKINDTGSDNFLIGDDSTSDNWWAILALILVIGTATGNILVCLAITWERRLQNVTNYFLMSLAVTDLMVAVLVMPLGILTLVKGE